MIISVHTLFLLLALVLGWVTVVKAAKGYIVTAAGRSSSGYSTNVSDAVNVGTHTWQSLANLPFSDLAIAMANIGDSVFAIGSSVVVYDNSAQRWNSFIQLPPGFSSCCYSAGSINETLYVIGGHPNFKSMVYFERGSLQWKTGPSSSLSLYYSSAAVLGNQFYACGFSSQSCEVYDATAAKWSSIAPMHASRSGCTMTEFKGKLYLVGGATHNENEVYNPENDSWTYFASSVVGRKYHAAASDGEYMYVIAGIPMSGGTFLSSIERYDPSIGAWLMEDYDLPTARAFISAVYVQDLALSSGYQPGNQTGEN